ncbi:uncharacterized protein [Littorina saxatilis]|uniref:uncharacterized protein isoform X2 n=1 Tax=Littorina saxatilis TaxID=31220 RepID=UPI0038B55285
MSPGRRSIVPVVLLFTVFSTLEGSLETWGPWGSCSNSCGSGSQSRSRACNNTAPLTGGTNCSVTLSETQFCNVHACSKCLKTHTSGYGTIRTQRVVNSSHECTFIIQQPQSYVIYLQFQNFHVGNDTVNCTTNYVEIRDGDEEGSPLLGRRYCGTDTPPLLTSSQNMTWIRYVTDGSDIAAGFNATYWRAEPCPTVVLTERNGTFTSPSYPGYYRDYMYCTWKITAETNNVIRLTFANFSLESHPDCRYDWVEILDGATSRGRYCGESGPGTLTSSSNRVTVTFKTDVSITKPGFSVSYVTYPSSADMSLDYTSKGKVSNSSPGVHVIVTGYDVTATCSYRTPGVSEPKFDWTLGGRDITTMQSSRRYVISLANRSDNDPFKFVSSVRIKEILTTESGQLVCNVTAAGNTINKQVALHVVAKLETTLNPSSSIVSPGSDVNLVCVRRAGYEVPWQAILYPAESAGGQVQDVVVNKTEKDEQANFTIRGVSSTVRYRCNISDSIATAVSNEATIFISEPATRNCLEDEDWAETPGGNTAHLSCPQGYADGGLQYRQCGTNGQWREPDTSQCVRQELEDLKTTIDQIGTGKTNATTKDVVKKLQNSTGGSRPLLSGDVTAAIDILDKVANFTVDAKQAPGEGELETFVMIADNVLHASSDVWQDQTTKALSLVNAVDRMGKASSRTLNSSGSQRPITSNKIVLQVGRSDRNDIMFPTPSQAQNYPEWVTAANNSAFLSKDAIGPGIDEVGYSAVIYRNLSNVFSGQVNQTLPGLSELSINSPILALSLALDGDRLLKPVRLTFDHIMVNFSSASCQFLDFSASAKGIWSTKGCWVTTSNSNMTVCECDHLTNFAVLMSPYRPAKEVADVLNVFSIVGCSISIFCLILTLAIYFIFWRYVKSDRSVLLVHMCVVLVLAYVTFLAGVNRVENEIVCTVVAGLLHYLWLVVFFLMLCEGIDIFITIVIIFPTKSALAWLLLTAYGVPVIIVGVSMGVTKSQGYGGTVFCWLSLEEGLFWAFVGPAVTALVANFVVIVIVIYTLLNSRVMIKKDKRERAKSVVKAICVMTPILGLSWIFGVMSVNDDTVVFQILFVVFNSLQGLMIFILHCLLSKQVREGMQHKLRRYQTNSKGVDDSSSKYVTQKQTSESNMSSNDLDRKAISPFLQVDRQVQQMASKLSMLDSSKVMALRNPVAGITRAPPAQEPPINIQMNESTMDGRGGAYARSRGGRFSLSAPYIGITPALRNPVYHDAVPALSSGYRWVRVTQSTKPQQHQRRGQQHPPVRHPSGPSPFQQPHPSSFYRLAASADNVGSSAENVGSSYYQPFATPKQIHKRHGKTRQPTQVDAKPSMLYHEPPVDYQ